jgi:hypothetical protein
VRCAAAKPRVNAEKPRFFINAQKKIIFLVLGKFSTDFFGFSNFFFTPMRSELVVHQNWFLRRWLSLGFKNGDQKKLDP